MTLTPGQITAIAFGASMTMGVLFKVIDALIRRVRPVETSHSNCEVSREMKTLLREGCANRDLVRDLHQWHSQRDSEGNFLWYAPRWWGTVLRELVAVTRDQVQATKDLTVELKKSNGRVRT